MDGKEKNRFDGMKRKDLIKYFDGVERLINKARSGKELEAIKVDLIKSYKPMKEDPSLLKLNEPRIAYLKRVNLNLQFLHRIYDVRRKMAQLDVKNAYEDILEASRAMYTHPDRADLHDWIRQSIRQELEVIAEKATEAERERQKQEDLRHAQPLGRSARKTDQTFIPGVPSSGPIHPKTGATPHENRAKQDPLQTLKPETPGDEFNIPTAEFNSPFPSPSSAADPPITTSPATNATSSPLSKATSPHSSAPNPFGQTYREPQDGAQTIIPPDQHHAAPTPQTIMPPSQQPSNTTPQTIIPPRPQKDEVAPQTIIPSDPGTLPKFPEVRPTTSDDTRISPIKTGEPIADVKFSPFPTPNPISDSPKTPTQKAEKTRKMFPFTDPNPSGQSPFENPELRETAPEVPQPAENSIKSFWKQKSDPKKKSKEPET